MSKNPSSGVTFNISGTVSGDFVARDKYVSTGNSHVTIDNVNILKSQIEAQLRNTNDWKGGMEPDQLQVIMQALRDLHQAASGPEKKPVLIAALQNLKEIIRKFPGSALFHAVKEWDNIIK